MTVPAESDRPAGGEEVLALRVGQVPSKMVTRYGASLSTSGLMVFRLSPTRAGCDTPGALAARASRGAVLLLTADDEGETVRGRALT